MRIHTLARGSAVAMGLVLLLAACNNPPGYLGPPGAFRLEGTVVDGNLTLPGVEVSVIQGTGQGHVTQTDSAGVFTLNGVGGQIRLRFRKQGYGDQIELVNITANTQRTFDLARSRVDLGPFRLEGNVTDGGFSLPGVEVSVIEGTGRGLVTQTNSAGAFTLDGVQGQIQLRLRKQGYPDQIEQVNVTVNTRSGFSLGRDAARPDYAGTYALTISTAASCAAAIPQRRTYLATIARDSSTGPGRINVSLSGADFVKAENGTANRFAGVVDPSGGIIFSLGNSDVFSDFDLDEVIERLGTVELVIGGVATTTGSPQRISGPLAGTLGIVADAETSPRTYLAECKSEGHTLEFVRQ
jgi:Carboxypeptidase regulatory-like domain